MAQLQTTRFGTIDYEAEQVITFTQPILGFQEFRRFLLLPGPPGGAVKWLQAVEAGDLAFILADPVSFISNYTVELAAHELTELAVQRVDELLIFTLVVVPEDRTRIRTNLKAPILINPKHRLGKQTILERGDYPVQYYLRTAGGGPHAAGEASHARSNS